jgi:hypothetical protein
MIQTLEEIEDLEELRNVLLKGEKYLFDKIENIIRYDNKVLLTSDYFLNHKDKCWEDNQYLNDCKKNVCEFLCQHIQKSQNTYILPVIHIDGNSDFNGFYRLVRDKLNSQSSALEKIFDCNQKYLKYSEHTNAFNKDNIANDYKFNTFKLNIANDTLWEKITKHDMVKSKNLSIEQFKKLVYNMAIAF